MDTARGIMPRKSGRIKFCARIAHQANRDTRNKKKNLRSAPKANIDKAATGVKRMVGTTFDSDGLLR